eukprot:768052-Hanusia_phi.AAC.3
MAPRAREVSLGSLQAKVEWRGRGRRQGTRARPGGRRCYRLRSLRVRCTALGEGETFQGMCPATDDFCSGG